MKNKFLSIFISAVFVFTAIFLIALLNFSKIKSDASSSRLESLIAANDSYVNIIVELDEEPVLHKTEKKLSKSNLKTKEDTIKSLQDTVKARIRKDIGAKSKFTYTHTFNGFSLDVSKKDIEKIKKMPNVKKVYISRKFSSFKPMLNNIDSKISINPVYDLGYDGEGTAVAIIDNGFYVNHPFFTLKNTETIKFKKADISDIIANNNLNAKLNFGSLTADDVFKNEKIPFTFDYAGNDADTSIRHHHGTAVAGIAAGNDTERSGIAKEAQLILMKVATDSGGITEDAILAAFDDAVKIGVDSINISIGSDNGFTDVSEEYLDFNEPFDIAKSAGITIAVSAGNSARADENGDKSTVSPYPLSENTDYGMVATPSTAKSALSVGSYNRENSTKIYQISAWGCTPDLKIKPDIVAPSSLYTSNVAFSGQTAILNYATSSNGTSYASPVIAGASAVVKQYINENFDGLSPAETSLMVEQLLMSSAEIVKNGNVPYSVRKQGSGLINVKKAVDTKVVLHGSENKTKINLGDKLNKTFTVSFTAKNISDVDISFSPNAYVVTDNAVNNKLTESNKAMGTSQIIFSDEIITVPAGSEKEVSATITLDDAAVLSQQETFINGFFVEGFIELISEDNPSISIPFMGYYGDWLDAPVFIEKPYPHPFGLISTSDRFTPSDYFSGKLGAFNINFDFYMGYLGDNRFSLSDSYDINKICFSPNGDNEFDDTYVWMSLFRNIKYLTINVKDGNNNILKSFAKSYVEKMQHVENLFNDTIYWDGKDSDNKLLPEGRYYYEAVAVLDYPGAENKPQSLTLPIIIDLTEPTVTGVNLLKENDKTYLEISLKDNYYLQGLIIKENGTENRITITDSIPEETYNVRYEISGDTKKLNIETYDYAFNQRTSEIKLCNAYVAYYNYDNKIAKVTKEEAVLLDGVSTYKVDRDTLINYSYAMVYFWDEYLNPLAAPIKVFK